LTHEEHAGLRPGPVRRWRPAPWLALALLAATPAARAEEAVAAEPAAQSEDRAMWRGSFLSYRNSVSLNSFDRGAELTYDPSYLMGLELGPRLWFGDALYVRASLAMQVELTTADDTTYQHELVLGDLAVVAGLSKILTLPLVGVDVSFDLVLTTPTSKLSQARSLRVGFGPGLRLSRSFDLLAGLEVGYTLRFNGNLHRYTTSTSETASIVGCTATDGSCDPFRNSGLRNSQLRVVNSLDLSLAFLSWLRLELAYGLVLDWTYPFDDDGGSRQQRHGSQFDAALAFQALPSLGVALGLSTVSPQLAPDASYYNPFYNRYSLVYLDLRLDFGGLVEQLTREDGED